METVESADGTEIGFERHGTGPPLVLLHGSASDRESWRGLIPHFPERYSLVVPDRRGRGASGDADEYALDREVEDLLALVESLEEPPVLFGHSYGALIALLAEPALDLRALILYEPPILLDEYRESDLAASMEAKLAAGDRRGALREFLEVAGGVADVEQLPWWPEQAHFDLLETIIRESYAVGEYELPEEVSVSTPTLLLTGEYGPPHLRHAVQTLARRLPGASLVDLDGVGHVAIQTAPKRVAAELLDFLESQE